MTKPLPVDGGVRRARPSDAPAVGLVQAEVFRDAYADVLPAEVIAHAHVRAAESFAEGLVELADELVERLFARNGLGWDDIDLTLSQTDAISAFAAADAAKEPTAWVGS